MKRKYGPAFYVAFVVLWMFAIVLAATIVAALVFPPIALLFGAERSWGELAIFGARNAAEWSAKVWAFGIALVLAVHHAYRHRHDRKPQ